MCIFLIACTAVIGYVSLREAFLVHSIYERSVLARIAKQQQLATKLAPNRIELLKQIHELSINKEALFHKEEPPVEQAENIDQSLSKKATGSFIEESPKSTPQSTKKEKEEQGIAANISSETPKGNALEEAKVSAEQEPVAAPEKPKVEPNNSNKKRVNGERFIRRPNKKISKWVPKQKTYARKSDSKPQETPIVEKTSIVVTKSESLPEVIEKPLEINKEPDELPPTSKKTPAVDVEPEPEIFETYNPLSNLHLKLQVLEEDQTEENEGDIYYDMFKARSAWGGNSFFSETHPLIKPLQDQEDVYVRKRDDQESNENSI